MFLMPLLIELIGVPFLTFLKIDPSNASLTLLYYMLSFIIVLIIMNGFLKDSFSILIDKNFSAISIALIGYFQYFAMFFAIAAVFLLITSQPIANPNTAAITTQVANKSNHLIFSMIFLAPIVEETLFRGALFDIVRRKNRIAAYAVSYLFFSVYHLWGYALRGINPMFIFYMLQYLPGSLVLANCYEKSGTIWSPIILHMMINGISVFINVSQ
jgi:membrane protease YdiL (CAAX protease family)